jgi:hypothetical protein
MARKHEGEAEVRECKIMVPVIIKGQAYEAGDVVALTQEEYQTCVAAGVSFEGEKEKTPEEIQAAHDAGREALKARLEEEEKVVH